jgi:transposase
MARLRLPNQQWQRIYRFLDDYPRLQTAREAEVRRFVEAVLWMARSGAPWRLLPSEYGDWNAVYKRFARWDEGGVWQAMHRHFAHDPDLENVLIDSTAVRAHPCAAGAPAQKGGRLPKRSAAAGAGLAPRSM